MASKNQVTLTFAGDSKNLEKSFDRVGSGAKNMGKDVDASADKFNRVGEAADTVDTRAMGMRDTFTGVQDTFKGLTDDSKTFQERALLLGMGLGDLGSGVYNFIVPAMQSLAAKLGIGTAAAATQTSANTALGASWIATLGPILLVVAAIAAAIAIGVLIVKNWDTIKAAAGVAFNFVKNVASSAFDWFKRNWPLLLAILTGPFGLAVLAISKHKESILGFFRGIPGAIKGFFSGLASAISSPFETAFRAIKRVWNAGPGGFGFSIPSWVPGVGGKGFHIPSMHTGGVVPGAPGQERLILAMAGEHVSRAGASGGNTYVFHVAGSIISERELVKVVRDAVDRGGFGR